MFDNFVVLFSSYIVRAVWTVLCIVISAVSMVTIIY